MKGYTNNIEKIWEDHHLHIIASCTESAPISLVEAMICGRPSIVTDTGGMTEWINDEKNGFISENIHPKFLKHSFLKAFGMQDKWEQIGRTAHNDAIKLMKNPEQDFLKLLTKI